MAWTRLKESIGLGRWSDSALLPSPERVRAAVERNDLLGGEEDAVEAILADG